MLMFENFAVSIASFLKYSVEGQGEATKKWGTITFFSPKEAQRGVHQLSNAKLEGSYLYVYPLKVSLVMDQNISRFPIVKEMLKRP